jgi:hypothetical protein
MLQITVRSLRAQPGAARLAGWVLILAALLLYVVTLDNGLQPEEMVGGDLITHQYAQVQARPSNAPGYPLYTMGGWLWFHGGRALLSAFGNELPNPIRLLSSYSTLWAILALACFYRLLLELTRSPRTPAGDWPFAWLVSAFYAVTYFFWYYATTTEQYSSAIAQTLAIVWGYLAWQAQPAGRRKTLYLLLLSFLCGLSLAHMLTVAFIVPPLVAVILWQAPQLLRRPGVVVAAVFAAALPLISYLYVYWRGAAHPEWWGSGDWPNANAWFWSFISTRQGFEELGWGLEAGRAFWGNQFPELIAYELSLPLLGLGLIGIALLPRKLPVVIYGTLVIYAIFCWVYRYGNWYQVILPAYPLILLGLVGVWLRVQAAWSTRWLPRLVYGGLLVLIIWRSWASWPAANSHNRPGDTALERASILIAQPLPRNAYLFAELSDILGLQYLSQIWSIRPDLQMVSSLEAGELLRAGQPVFATWSATPLLAEELPADLQPVRQVVSPDWIRFQLGAADALEAPAIQLDETILPGITLLGYHLAPAPTPMPVLSTPDRAVDLTLVWQLNQPWPPDLAISVRPTYQGAGVSDGDALIQVDRAMPAQGLVALADADAVVVDAYRVPLAGKVDGIMVIVYRHQAGEFTNLVQFDLPLTLE